MTCFFLYAIFILLICGLIFESLFIYYDYKRRLIHAGWFKSLAAFCFVLIGVSLISDNLLCDYFYFWKLLICLGLFFGMLGDIFRAVCKVSTGTKSKLFNLAGTVAFITGHLLYITTWLTIENHILLPYLIFLPVLYIPTILFVLKKGKRTSKGEKVLGTIYLLIVISMFSVSLSEMLVTRSYIARQFTLGAFFFMTSDIITIGNSIAHRPHKRLRALNLLNYYAGQMIIAFCLLFDKIL
ncbi:MAG: lysoplasmalogenase [Treponema sp.]|nr:lysoplasmalogenase [Treponema sp.]